MTQAHWLKYLTLYFRRLLRGAVTRERKLHLARIVKQCEGDEQQWKNRHQLRLMLVGREKGNVRRVG